MSATNAEILARGMKCLTQEMEILEAEQFVSIIIREKSDYTRWQREYFDAKTPKEISREVTIYAQRLLVSHQIVVVILVCPKWIFFRR